MNNEQAAGPALSMLNKPAQFAAFRAGSRFRAGTLLSVRVRRSGLTGVRLGFATGKELGGAVERNRVRRCLRVAVGQLLPRLIPGSDILVIARAAAVPAGAVQLEAELCRLLSGAGALRPAGESADEKR